MASSEIDRNSGSFQPTIVRTTGSTVLFFVVTGLCTIGVVSILFGDFSPRGLAAAGIPAAVGTLVFALYRFPRVELHRSELVLVNPLQTVTIPWNLVDGFETHFGLAVRTHEKKFGSWPLAGRGKKWEKDEHDMRRLVESPNPAVDTVLDRYARLSDEELANPGGKRTIRTVWNLGIIVAGLLAVAWAAWGVAVLPG
ncbi:hypothetical protein [Brevibacterium sp. SMBL_HHYL_HB1]|uniref:hypothetical protein n=1 Tax=Brevibacterium sp. SMBL_HHYL_HB1 TaxID=2777556 RepID=UPI001BA4769A|nr:hypothetical protein [Brevibacterium sp. SMBL_HHYL_HB1]QUL80774.1 hypothetical protein IG171_08550 [Brevibacterium sp. SMBL_HHYL_HB1]